MADFSYRYAECKYAVREKDCVYCKRDGSIRKRGCPCQHYTLSWWQKIKRKIFG